MQNNDKYEVGLGKNRANYVSLTPLTFLRRSALVYPDRVAIIHGNLRRTWSQVYERCVQMAAALKTIGVGQNSTVAALCSNLPEMIELHFSVAMAGGVLNALNTRLDADSIAFMLSHGESKVFMVDQEFFDLAKNAVNSLATAPKMVIIEDKEFLPVINHGELTYAELLAKGDPQADWEMPDDEWQAITLSYTSGTTGDPKGVVFHHRGAHLSAISNILSWQMQDHPVYLWTLPMFHCNGWCFIWSLAVVAGTSICLRQVRPEAVFTAFLEHQISHFCGAPVVLNMLINSDPDIRGSVPSGINVMTAGAPPPEAVIAGMENMGFKLTHVYGLTETYGPSTLCAPQDDWNGKSMAEMASIKARQGVPDHILGEMMVADPKTMQPVARDGTTMGEIFLRGNKVMKGYLSNPKSTMDCFAGGWFHTGDLAVVHQDGYAQIKDRSKDIIISGGENISSVEVEEALYKHPNILEAAVVARQDEVWGESPCAFVTLVAGVEETEQSIIDYCRLNMAHFKAPKTVVFMELPKTSTGKIKKYELREVASKMQGLEK